MPEFIITTTATAPIRERWSIEADNAEHAQELFEESSSGVEVPSLKFLDDEIIGDEEDRQVEGVVQVDPAPEPDPRRNQKIEALVQDALNGARANGVNDLAWFVREYFSKEADVDLDQAMSDAGLELDGEEG
ncbi:MAG TPA: hypothetical protein H9899_07125 [Candidatus Sphingomonas excrementigallinarum]|nr:hypothetical protein [Candidatus Sphingomonas excrementigallinarum]